jgi:hypothetical protein
MAKKVKGGVVEVEVTSKGSLKKLSKDAKQAGKDVGSVAKSTAESDRRLKSLSGQTSNSSKAFSKQAQTIQGGLVPVYATLAAQVFAVSAAFRFLQDSVNFRNLVAGQAAYGAATGNMFSVISKAVRNASNGLISYQDASQAVAIGTAAGLNAGQLERLGKAASDVSLALGRDVVDSFNRLVRGVTKAEPELLDELGIILRLDPALKQYAAQLGKSKEDLNQFERAQAVTNFVLDQAESKFGKISQVIAPSAFALGQFQQAFNDMLNDLQVGLAGIVDFVAPFFTQNIQAFAAALLVFISSIVKSMLPNFDMIVAKGAQTVTALKTQIKEIEGEVRVLGATQTIKSKTGAERMRREGLQNIQSIDPTVGSLSNQQVSARLRVLRSGKELSALKNMDSKKVAIYTSGLEKMEAATKFHKGKEVIEVQTAEQKKQLAHAQTTLKQEQQLLKQEERQRRNAKIAVGIFRAIYIAGFVVMAAQATKAIVKFLTMSEKQRKDQQDQIKGAKELADTIADVNKNLEKMIELRNKSLVDSPFTQFARSLQGQDLEKQIQDVALLDPDFLKQGQLRKAQQEGPSFALDGGRSKRFLERAFNDNIKIMESSAQAVEDLGNNLNRLIELSPDERFVAVFEKMKTELADNNKITPATTKEFLKLQKQIIETEQSARQFNQTSQDLSKGLTGLATSFAPKTTFMNIEGLVQTNRSSMENAINILKKDVENFQNKEGFASFNSFMKVDFDMEKGISQDYFENILGLSPERAASLAGRVSEIIDQRELLTALQPILDANLIKEREINKQLAENKTFRAEIVKDGSALAVQQKLTADNVDRRLKTSASITKEESLQAIIKDDKIKKDPRMLAALEHALSLQEQVTAQLRAQNKLALMTEQIRRDGLRNELALKEETSQAFGLEHMFGVAGKPVTEQQVQDTMDKHPSMTRKEAIENLQQFNSELAISELKLSMVEGLSTSIGTNLMDGFANAFVEVAKGTTTFAAAFKNMAIQILAEIATMTMRMLILNTLFPGGGSVNPMEGIDTSLFTTKFDPFGGHYNPKGRSGGIMSSPGYRSYARGGIAMGPDSGYAATLHGTEAVVPLGNSRSIPVELKGAGGGTNNITVNVNGATEGSGQNPQQAKALGDMIQASTMEIIQREKRPGGVLSR